MQNALLRKGLVVGIILLFVGTSVGQNISGNNTKENKGSISYGTNRPLDLSPSSESNAIVKEENNTQLVQSLNHDKATKNISLNISENITFIDNNPSEAHLAIMMDISSAQLVALYKEAFDIPNNATAIDTEIPLNATRFLEVQRDGKTTTTERTDPVREQFYEGISKEQQYLFGFQITAFTSSRIASVNGQDALKIYIDADADPYLADSVKTGADVTITMCGAPADTVNDFVYAQLDIAHVMLLSFPGTQQYLKSWDVNIILPDNADIISAGHRQGKMDLGGGSFIQTEVSKLSSKKIHIDETWVVTENTFEKKTVDLGRIFSIEYSIPLLSCPNLNIVNQSFNHSDFRDETWDWNQDWEAVNLSGHTPVDYTILVTLYLHLTGTLHVDLWDYTVWAQAGITAGLEINATITGTWEHDFNISLGKFSGRIYGWRGGQPFFVVVQVEPEAALHIGVSGTVHVLLNPEANFWIKAGGHLDLQWWWPPVKFTPIFDYGMGGSFEREINVSAHAEIRPSLSFALSLIVFDVIGPRITPELYLDGELNYSPGNGVYWHAVLGFDLMVGIQFTNFLHWDWPNPIVDIPIKEWDSAQDPGHNEPVDTTPPVTSLGLAPKVNGWTGRNTRFWFDVVEPEASASGLNKTYFNVPDSQYPSTWFTFNRSQFYYLIIPTDNQTTGLFPDCYRVKYYSVDNASNIEQTHTDWVNVDLDPPVSQITVGQPSNGHYISVSTPITLSATDQGAGTWVVFYRFWYNGGWSDWNNSNCSWSVPFVFHFNEIGEHRIQWFAVDGVGNIEKLSGNQTSHEATFYVMDEFTYLIADANGPYNATAGQAKLFSALGSQPVQLITGYRWDWTSDGTWDTNWSSSPFATHSFDHEGLYLAELQVKDNKGETSIAFGAVHISVSWNLIVAESKGLVGFHNSIAVDSDNHPHISHMELHENPAPEGYPYLKYDYWDGSQWIRDTIDSDCESGGWHSTAIAVDTLNRPHIAYGYDGTGPNYSLNLRYAYKDATGWHISTVDPQIHTASYIDIALDSNNYPHISYQYTNTNDHRYLRYARWDGNQWTLEQVSLQSNEIYTTSIVIDNLNRPHISCEDKQNNRILYARKNTDQSWTIRIVASNIGSHGGYNAIALDSNGNPYICFSTGYDAPDPNTLKCIHSNDGGDSWLSPETVDQTSPDVLDGFGDCNIVINKNNDYAYISYEKYENSLDSLMIAMRSIGKSKIWAIETLDDIHQPLGNSIAVDTNGLPYISYLDWTCFQDLRLATLAGGINSDPIANAGGNSGSRGIYNGKSQEPITFNADEGFDFDGNITGYRWDWTNDGVWDTDWNSSMIVNHSYSTSGTYTIKLGVIDDWGATDNATADVTIENSPPNTPVNPSPFSGTLGVNINTSLCWTGSDPDSGDIVTYKIYFGTNPNPPFVTSINKPATQINVTWNPGSLNYLTKYYWKIVAQDNNGVNVSGPTLNFTTGQMNHPPNIPSNPSPSNGSLNISVYSELSWDGGDPDIEDIVAYNIYFGTTPNPPLITTVGPYLATRTNTTWNPGPLNYTTQYHWRIVAIDQHNVSTGGPTWSFTTEIPDAISPICRNQGENKTSVHPSESISLSAQGKDNRALDWAWLATNETGQWQNFTTGPWWNTSWIYSKKLAVTNPQPNYQMPITVYKENNHDDINNGTIDCENHCNTNFSDIRFIADDHTTIVPYWIEKTGTTNGDHYAQIWVKTSGANISMYCGNPNAKPVSDATQTFIFYDSFTSTNGWTSTDNRYHVNTTTQRAEGTVYRQFDSRLYHSLPTPVSTNFTLRYRTYWVSNENDGAATIFELSNTNPPSDNNWGPPGNIGTTFYTGAQQHDRHGPNWRAMDGTSPPANYTAGSTNSTHYTWFNVSVAINGTYMTIKWWDNSHSETNPNYVAKWYHKTTETYYYFRIQNMNTSSGMAHQLTSYTDDIIIRKYVTPGPTWGLFGQEKDGGGKKYGSPLKMQENNQWQWSNFTWYNSTVQYGKVIGWRIYYIDKSGNVNCTNVQSFLFRDPNPPVFGTPNPANGSTGNPLSFTWSIPINEPEGDLFNWTIQCNNGQTNSGTSATNGTKTLALSGLTYSTPYKVWVNATDPDGSGLYTRKWYRFTTKTNYPPDFGTPNPTNGSTGNPLNITWSIPINDPDGDLFNWTIQCNNGQTNSTTGATNGTKTIALSGLAFSTTYKVWVNATDLMGSGMYTRKWYTFTTQANQPPNPPAIHGPASGKAKQKYDYTFNATDPNGENVFYYIDWGDNSNSGWIGPYSSGVAITQSHTWANKGTYTIKAKAKDIYGNESGWGTLSVTMPLSYEPPYFRFFEWLFERFPHAFPILRQLLGY